MHIDENHDWMDGFESWEEVETCLHDDWVRIVDVRQRLELERDLDDLVVVEVDRRLRARQRRELHRLGFRPVPAGRCTEWRWDLVEAVRTADPDDFPHPLLSSYERMEPARRPRSYDLLRAKVVADGLIDLQVRRVVQEVFRSAAADLAVVAYRESALWGEEDDEDEDEDWQRPTG
jgi:hypothetical protein